MNRIYQLIWNDKSGAFVPVSEKTRISGRRSSSCTTAMGSRACGTLKALIISLMMAFGTNAYALPAGGVVTAGGASISSGAAGTTVTQSTQNAAISWQSFNIGQGETVRFVQPNSSSVALNRVLGSDPSSILGSLSANGKVFLLNPNGILFGKGASVNVGGMVASTLNITDTDFMAGTYKFAGAGNGTILNQGSINANGGYVALLGANVSNEGIISAKLGTVALAAGNAITLDVAGDGLLNVTVNQGAVNALVQNGGLIRADGGQVLLTAQSAGNLLQSAVNNTGVIQAQTVENHNGTIKLLGDMQSGTVNVGGTLDASAPNGGNGGFVETSAAHVKVADNAIITTQAAQGKSGTWLIDPHDFTIANSGGDITPTTLSNNLASDVTIASTSGTNGSGNGDINVNNDVTWNAPTTLTLNAVRNVNVNAAVTATGGNVVMRADNDGKGEGTVKFAGGGKVSAILTTIRFNPADYTTTAAEIAAYLPKVTGALDAKAWVFAKGEDKVYDGTRDAEVYTTLRPDHLGNQPPGESLTTVGALFDTKDVGHDKLITFSSYTLTGSTDYALYVPYGTTDGSGIARADITPRALTGSIATGSSTYGSQLAPGAASLTGVVPGDVVTLGAVTVTPDKLSSSGHLTAGSHIGIESVGGALGGKDAGNYTFAGAVGDYTVVKLDTNISGTRVYDATPTAAGTNLATISALLTGDSVSVSGSGAVADKNVAPNKAITDMGTLALAGTDAGNYNLLANGNKLTVTPAPLTVKADDATKNYGQTPILSAFTPAGLLNGETIGSVTETSPGTAGNAGVVNSPYPITPSNATGGTFTPSNYNITYAPGALTVTPAPLTVKANDATKVDGQTLTLSTSAFTTPVAPQNGETISSVTQTSPGAAGNASVVNSPYPITPSNPTGVNFDPSNYIITYLPGALTVTPQVQPNPVITPPVTPQVQPTPIITPIVTPQAQPTPIITPVVTPQAQPNPIITPIVTPQAQPNPIITPIVTPQAQPTPIITPAVTPQVQPDSATAPTATPLGQPDPVIAQTVTPPVQPDSSIAPTVTPPVQPDPVIVATEMPPVQPKPVKAPVVKAPQIQPDPVEDPAETPPKRYIPPQRPRKNDRN